MYGTILNLTQHVPTREQYAQGVTNHVDHKLIQSLLTFVGMPTWDDVVARAEQLAALAAETGAESAMIGGAPYLMAPLHSALAAKGIRPLYAFSERRSVETTQADGSVVKTAVFVHIGFVG